jgi:hypothetical protein
MTALNDGHRILATHEEVITFELDGKPHQVMAPIMCVVLLAGFAAGFHFQFGLS